MSDNSLIPYVDSTWNPIRGTAGRWTCVKASEGCTNCYAERLNVRFGGPRYVAGADTPRLDEQALEQPLHWRRPRRIFVCSMSDLFLETVPDEWIVRVFEIVASTPRHTYLVLTKRPQRMREIITRYVCHVRTGENPLPNVQLGITAENQPRLEERIGHLLRTPAVVHWLSLEPLLSAMGLTRVRAGNGAWIDCLRGDVRTPDGQEVYAAAPASIRWVACGGESGGPPERRLVERCPVGDWHLGYLADAHRQCCNGTGWAPKPEALRWVRALRDECLAAKVPWFWKGWGGPTPTSGGHLLDGRAWQQLPEVR